MPSNEGPVHLTVCRFPDEHNPNHGTNYRFHVYNPRDPAAGWQHLTEAEMDEKVDPTYGWLVSSQYHFWDTP